MDRLIEVKVKGNHLTQDNNVAGVQYEGNVTALRIEFDKDWDNYAKTVIFFDAYGQNPVKRILTADLLEDFANNTRVYRCLIPAEPMQYDGKMSYVIEGYLNGKRQRGIEAKLKVEPSPYTDNAGQPTDPTPSQAEQLQVQVEAMIGTVRTERAQAETARVGAETARAGAETAQGKAEQAQAKAEEARDGAVDAEAMANSHLEDAKTNAGWAIAAADEATAAMRGAQTAQTAAETAQAEAETQARIATQSMTSAQHAEAGAEKAQAAAENAAGNAAEDAENAQNAAKNAATSADNAKQSEDAAEFAASKASYVYVGTGEMPEGCNVQIDPGEEAIDVQAVINASLQVAKESGEFKGDPFTYADFTSEQLANLKAEILNDLVDELPDWTEAATIETWQFTLADGTVIEKKVVVAS